MLRRTVLFSSLLIASTASCVAEEDLTEAEFVEEDDVVRVEGLQDTRPVTLVVATKAVHVHRGKHGWITMEGEAIFDLLQPKQIEAYLADQGLPEGRYDQIALDLTFAAMKTSDSWSSLELPKYDRLVITVSFCIPQPGNMSMPLDWNAWRLVEYDAKHWELAGTLKVRGTADCDL